MLFFTLVDMMFAASQIINEKSSPTTLWLDSSLQAKRIGIPVKSFRFSRSIEES